uniref:G-protein coupled receptors family 1 profile domain-containing protein n=1 Tax=Knipowitschia caucasica TaxID=637954 RepID=A0AAV2K775_KNICA
MDRGSREANWTSAQQHLWLGLATNASGGYSTTRADSLASVSPVTVTGDAAMGAPEFAASVRAYRDFTTAVQVLILLGSLLGNAAVLWCTCSTNVFRSVTKRFVQSLASAGVGASLVCVPFDLALGSSPLCCWWIHTIVVCKSFKFLHRLFCSVTVLCFSAIALDRYYSVLFPLERKISDSRSRDLVIYIWVHATVVSLPALALTNVTDVYASSSCSDDPSHSTAHLVYVLLYSLTTLVLPLALVLLFMLLIRRALSASQKKKVIIAALRTPQSSISIPSARHSWWDLLTRIHRRYSRRNVVTTGMLGSLGGEGGIIGEPAGLEAAGRSGSQLLEMFNIGQQQIFRPDDEEEDVEHGLEASSVAKDKTRSERSSEDLPTKDQALVKTKNHPGPLSALPVCSSPGHICAYTSSSQVAPATPATPTEPEDETQCGFGPFELPPQWLPETRNSKKRLLPPLGNTPEELIQTKLPRPKTERRISRNNKVSTIPAVDP